MENDHAASTPMETSVSMVEEPCRAALNAAVWNGHADQNVTGVARTRATQPQCGNCRAGTMETRNSGMVRIAAPMSRGRITSPDGPWFRWSLWSLWSLCSPCAAWSEWSCPSPSSGTE